MTALMEKFWFCVDSGEKVNFMGFLEKAGFHGSMKSMTAMEKCTYHILLP